MFWQLLVLVAAAAVGLLAVLAVKVRHAQQVLDRIIVRLDDPDYDTHRDDADLDEVARQRGRRDHARPTFIPHPAHGHHRFRH